MILHVTVTGFRKFPYTYANKPHSVILNIISSIAVLQYTPVSVAFRYANEINE